MLSKSSARRFFLLGTLVCSGAFVLLTLDTIRQVPIRTHVQNLTEEVIRGKHIWDTKNCMGCHTLMGEGAYYAPELTKVFTRRGEAFMRAILKDPQSMYPGQRQMVNYHLSDQEINDLIAFLKWIGEVDLNGFPAKPDLGVMTSVNSAATTASAGEVSAIAQPQVFGQVCVACHSVGNVGGNVGPALDGISLRRDANFLKNWLKDPMAIKADSRMPKLPLTEEQIQELVTYLSSLKSVSVGEVTK